MCHYDFGRFLVTESARAECLAAFLALGPPPLHSQADASAYSWAQAAPSSSIASLTRGGALGEDRNGLRQTVALHFQFNQDFFSV